MPFEKERQFYRTQIPPATSPSLVSGRSTCQSWRFLSGASATPGAWPRPGSWRLTPG